VTLDDRPRRAPGVIAQKVSDKVILLNVDSGRYYSLDGVAAKVWELCDGLRPVSDTIAVIRAEYPGGHGTVEEDVLSFLGDLARERLIDGAH
jgi:hypothetical protein